MKDHERRHSPAAERNRAPILAQLQRLLPASGRLLEIASGSGQHAAHFAAALPAWRWLPSDAQTADFDSIRSWSDGLTNVAEPVRLDVLEPAWPGAPDALDAIYCANMLHVAPWAACGALMRGAARHLAPAGCLITYGPYLVDGEPTAPSNLAFDADLRARDPAWGLRALGGVVREAERAGLVLSERVAMPANNLLLVFARRV